MQTVKSPSLQTSQMVIYDTTLYLICKWAPLPPRDYDGKKGTDELVWFPLGCYAPALMKIVLPGSFTFC